MRVRYIYKLIIILSVMPVLTSCASAQTNKPSYNGLLELAKNIITVSKELDVINIKLRVLCRMDKPVVQKDLLDGLNRVSEVIDHVSRVSSYESQLLMTIPYIKEEEREAFVVIRTTEIEKPIQYFPAFLQELNYYYNNGRYWSVLFTLDNPIPRIEKIIKYLSEAKEILVRTQTPKNK